MPSVKISALPSGTGSYLSTDLIPTVESGTTKKRSMSNFFGNVPSKLTVSSGGAGITGDVTINGKITQSSGASGASPEPNSDNIVIQDPNNGGISILTPITNVGIIAFGNPTSNVQGRILYRHSSSYLELESGGVVYQRIRNGAIDLFGNVTISNSLSITGALSKGSGTFKIPHPVTPDEKWLVHSFTESPQPDLIYSGMVTLKKGKATIDLNESQGMSPGTFQALCRNIRRKTSNEGGFTAIKSSFNEETAILTIEAEDTNCTGEIFWQVIGERKDPVIMDAPWTDDNGNTIIEPVMEWEEIPETEEDEQIYHEVEDKQIVTEKGKPVLKMVKKQVPVTVEKTVTDEKGEPVVVNGKELTIQVPVMKKKIIPARKERKR